MATGSKSWGGRVSVSGRVSRNVFGSGSDRRGVVGSGSTQ